MLFGERFVSKFGSSPLEWTRNGVSGTSRSTWRPIVGEFPFMSLFIHCWVWEGSTLSWEDWLLGDSPFTFAPISLVSTIYFLWRMFWWLILWLNLLPLWSFVVCSAWWGNMGYCSPVVRGILVLCMEDICFRCSIPLEVFSYHSFFLYRVNPSPLRDSIFLVKFFVWHVLYGRANTLDRVAMKMPNLVGGVVAFFCRREAEECDHFFSFFFFWCCDFDHAAWLASLISMGLSWLDIAILERWLRSSFSTFPLGRGKLFVTSRVCAIGREEQ